MWRYPLPWQIVFTNYLLSLVPGRLIFLSEPSHPHADQPTSWPFTLSATLSLSLDVFICRLYVRGFLDHFLHSQKLTSSIFFILTIYLTTISVFNDNRVYNYMYWLSYDLYRFLMISNAKFKIFPSAVLSRLTFK